MNNRPKGTSDNQYLRTRIKDEKGHYERWPEIRVHPDVDTAARAYLSDPACECESMSDLIRTSVIEKVARARVTNPTTKSIITILKAWDESNRKMEMRRKFKLRIEETAREAYELVGEGKTNEAAKHIHGILMNIRDLPEDDPWRAECETLLKQKFGYLLKMTQVSSLVPEIGMVNPEAIEWEKHGSQ